MESCKSRIIGKTKLINSPKKATKVESLKTKYNFIHLMLTGGTAGVLLVVPRLATFSLVGSSKDGFLFSTRKQDL